MSTTQGIDLSYCQTNLDYKKLKANGVTFAIIQAGYGRTSSQKDKMFETHYKGCKDAGIKVGVYWFSYAISAEDAKLEAKACMEVIKGKQFEFPVYFDLEGEPLNNSKAVCSAMVDNFCTLLKNNGWYPGLYISRSPLQTKITDTVAKKYALWIAEYSNKCNYSGTYGMWQNTSRWSVGGAPGLVDHDYCYVDYPTIIKNGGFNGYKKPIEKVLDKDGYVKGDSTIGVLALKQMIIAAKKKGIIKQGVNNDNVFGNGTEKAVNELLKKWGYKQNGVAGNNFIRKIGELM